MDKDTALDEIKKKLLRGDKANLTDIVNLINESDSKISDFDKKRNQEIQLRGAVIDSAVQMESIISEVLNHLKIKEIPSRFKDKMKLIKNKLIESNFQSDLINESFYEKMRRAIRIRHLFGHVPIEITNKGLYFFNDKLYSQWKKDIKDKSAPELAMEFWHLSKELNVGFVEYFNFVWNNALDIIEKGESKT